MAVSAWEAHCWLRPRSFTACPGWFPAIWTVAGFFPFFPKSFRTLFVYDRFSINLYDAEREFLNSFTSADGTVVEMFSNTRIAQNTVAWQAIQTRKPVVINESDFAGLGGGASSLASAGLNATIALPLILNREVVGPCTFPLCVSRDNVVEILNFLLELCPVLTIFLFVVLTEERRPGPRRRSRLP